MLYKKSQRRNEHTDNLHVMPPTHLLAGETSKQRRSIYENVAFSIFDEEKLTKLGRAPLL